MAEVLGLLSIGLPIAGGGGLLIVGLWGLGQLRQEGIRGASLRRAVAIAAIIAIGAALLVWPFATSMGCFMSVDATCTDRTRGPALVVGLVSGVTLGLASLAGFGVAARLRAGSPSAIASMVGSLAGSAVLVGALAALTVGSSSLASAASQARMDREADDLVARSAILHLTATAVSATASGDGETIVGVELTALLTVDRDLEVATHEKTLFPRFTLQPPGSFPTDGQLDGAVDALLIAGKTTTYGLSFDFTELTILPNSGQRVASTYTPPRPGTWTLRVEILGTDGETYQVSVPVQIGVT